ncbi:hypothetical protein [Salmonella phage SSBI34]|nr:hypothetical protein [Salmonella phage SSBI34]
MQKLTKAEEKWIRDLQKVIDRCPSDRLGFYTIGDPMIGIYNLEFLDKISDMKGDLVSILNQNGWGFDEIIYFPAPVEGVCG